MSSPMGILPILPQIGGSTNVWATALGAVFNLIDQHSHAPGQGVQIPTAGLGIDSDLTFASFAGTNLKAIAFTEVAASSMTSYADALFVSAADGDIYFRNRSAVNVRLTNGNSLDLSAIGGLGGDYAAVDALLSYDDATHRYLFQQEGSPRPWAGAAMGNLDIYEQAASIGTFVRLSSPHALAANYTLTLPTGLPGAQVLLQLDASGNITASNTIAGHIAHGNQTITGYPHPTLASVVGGSVTATGGSPGATWPSSSDAYMPLAVLPAGAELQSLTINTDTSGAGTLTFTLYTMSALGALVAVTGATSTSHANPVTLTPTTPGVLPDGETYWLRITTDASSSTNFHSYTATYSVP